MSLDFSKNGYENLFKQALQNGISLFCGAGFSVEASDSNGQALPTGPALLDELKEQFPYVQSYRNLPRACTKLLHTDKGSFYSFLESRFAVEKFSNLYNALLGISIKNVYTTNIDDLFFRIYDNAYSTYYLNDLSIRGTDYVSAYKSSHKNQVNYFALHGCIRNPGEYVFGATEIASAFSNAISKQSWTSLAKDAEEHAILFWGWNFEDSGPIEAMYGVKSHVNENIKKWALLYKPEEETIDFLSSLNFNIIIGETQDMLQYMQDFRKESSEKVEILSIGSPIKELDEFIYPAENAVASYPLKSFFCDYTPRWSYVYSKSIPSISFYKKIAELIAAKRNVVFTGIRGSGKTTLLMQLIVNIETARLKHYMLAPTLESVEAYLKGLQNSQSLLFVDDCFRDTDAIVRLLRASNVQVVCCDRDFNFERQYHRIKPYNFETLDITGLTQEDAQAVINCIPMELKRSQLNTRKIEEDITLPNILASALKAQNYRYMQIFHESDSLAAEIFLMICYVHSCGVPCSFDMVYSYLGDEQYSWQNMLDAIQRVGKLIKDCENSSDYFVPMILITLFKIIISAVLGFLQRR